MKIIFNNKPRMRIKPHGLILNPENYISFNPPETWRMRPKKKKKS